MSKLCFPLYTQEFHINQWVHCLRTNCLYEIYNKSISILLLFVNCMLHTLHKRKIYKLEYAYTQVVQQGAYTCTPFSFSENLKTSHFPLTPLRSPSSLPTRPPGPAAATRTLGQVRWRWARGRAWKLQAEGRKARVYSEGRLQNGLCVLRAFIYFHTSLRPLTPVWSQTTGRKVLFYFL